MNEEGSRASLQVFARIYKVIREFMKDLCTMASNIRDNKVDAVSDSEWSSGDEESQEADHAYWTRMSGGNKREEKRYIFHSKKETTSIDVQAVSTYLTKNIGSSTKEVKKVFATTSTASHGKTYEDVITIHVLYRGEEEEKEEGEKKKKKKDGSFHISEFDTPYLTSSVDMLREEKKKMRAKRQLQAKKKHSPDFAYWMNISGKKQINVLSHWFDYLYLKLFRSSFTVFARVKENIAWWNHLV